jgi:hypothetical protein
MRGIAQKVCDIVACLLWTILYKFGYCAFLECTLNQVFFHNLILVRTISQLEFT